MTKASDSERREVAASLRDDVSESECIDYAVFRIIHDVLGIKHATGAKAAHVLADLIERPTCHLVDREPGRAYDLICFSFGHKVSWPSSYSTPRHCPNCGAEVVRKVVGDDEG